MKIKDGFVMRDVAGQTVIIATGKASETFRGMIKLNKTGKDIWQLMENGLSVEEIIGNMHIKYEMDISKIKIDVERMISVMIEYGILE